MIRDFMGRAPGNLRGTYTRVELARASPQRPQRIVPSPKRRIEPVPLPHLAQAAKVRKLRAMPSLAVARGATFSPVVASPGAVLCRLWRETLAPCRPSAAYTIYAIK